MSIRSYTPVLMRLAIIHRLDSLVFSGMCENGLDSLVFSGADEIGYNSQTWFTDCNIHENGHNSLVFSGADEIGNNSRTWFTDCNIHENGHNSLVFSGSDEIDYNSRTWFTRLLWYEWKRARFTDLIHRLWYSWMRTHLLIEKTFAYWGYNTCVMWLFIVIFGTFYTIIHNLVWHSTLFAQKFKFKYSIREIFRKKIIKILKFWKSHQSNQ